MSHGQISESMANGDLQRPWRPVLKLRLDRSRRRSMMKTEPPAGHDEGLRRLLLDPLFCHRSRRSSKAFFSPW
jgi:hypothetical protein